MGVGVGTLYLCTIVLLNLGGGGLRMQILTLLPDLVLHKAPKTVKYSKYLGVAHIHIIFYGSIYVPCDCYYMLVMI